MHPAAAPLAALTLLAATSAGASLASCGPHTGSPRASGAGTAESASSSSGDEQGISALERALGLEPRVAPPPGAEDGPSAAGPAPAAARRAEDPAPPLPDWVVAPRVRVRLVDRDGTEEIAELDASEGDAEGDIEWTLEDGWRWSEARVPLGGLALVVWREQWRGRDATRVTVALVNGIAQRGVAYFTELEVHIDDSRVLHLEGRHCIVPRGILARRWQHGAAAARLASWEMIRDRLPSYGVERWAGQMAAKAIGWANENQKLLGPYNIGLPGVQGNTSFDGSHGGWLIGPYGGGSQSWHAGTLESWRLAEQSWLGTMARSPIAILDAETLQPYQPKQPYWLGRTAQHELPGFRELPDEWCPYAQELYWYRPHNYSHMWRQIRDAAQLARFDAAARWFLLTSWHDCLLWLDNGVGDEVYLTTHRALDWHVSSRPAGTAAPWAGRGFAHVVRCFLEAEPYLPADHAELWRKRLRAAIQHAVVPGTGVAHGSLRLDPLDSHLPDAERMQPPIARAREVDLLGACFLPLGLHQEDADWRRFMAPVDGESVSAAFEIRPGMRSWKDGKTAVPAYFPGYDAFRGDLSPYGGTVQGLLQAASTYYGGIGENPLDWTDPAVWRPAVPARKNPPSPR